MMRLVILKAPAGTSDHAIVRGLNAGELVLASRGVTLPACLAAFVAEARKEQPIAAHVLAFDDAERAALAAAFGTGAGEASLGLALSPGEVVPDVGPPLQDKPKPRRRGAEALR